MDWFESLEFSRTQECNSVIGAVKARVHRELSDMAQEINLSLTASPFREISAEAEFYLDLIASPMKEREARAIPLHEGSRTTRRFGFYPVSADPFHWGHLLIGLSAMARFQLAKIVYIIAGHDQRKPGMTHPTARHAMGRSILNLFTPLFEYSPVAAEEELDGESSLFRMFALYNDQRIHAFYLAGSDHCRRVDPVSGEADTVQKIEGHIQSSLYGFDGRRQRVSLLFVKRGLANCRAETRLDLLCMPGLSFDVSSTMIRQALAGGEAVRTLALLPHTAYLYIRALGLYAPQPVPGQKGRARLMKRVA